MALTPDANHPSLNPFPGYELKAAGPAQRILRGLLPVILGVSMGLVAALLILRQEWLGLAALVVVLPAVALVTVYPFISILAWLVIFPLFVESFAPGARSLYWLLHRAMIPGTLVVVSILHFSGLRRVKTVRWGIAEWSMLAFLVLGTANILLMTDDPQNELIRFYDRMVVPFILYGLVRVLAPKKEDIRWFIPAAFFVIFSQAVIGGVSWFAPRLLPSQWLSRVDERTVGTLGNPAVFTTTLVFYAIFLVQAFHELKSRFLRWTALATVGLAYVAVFFSFSRGSWGGALLVLAGMVYLYPKTLGRVALIGGIAAAILFMATPLRSYLNFAEQRLLTESTAEGRVLGGAATLRMIQGKPLLGWGYNNNEKFDEKFRDRVLGLAINKAQSSHNTYLLIAAELGLAGLSLYLFPALYWLVRSFQAGKRLPRDGFPSRVVLVMLWFLLADHMIVSSFTDLVQSNFYSTGMWWLTLGLIANMVDHARSRVSLRRI